MTYSELYRAQQRQQSRRLYCIPGHTHDARALPLVDALSINVHDRIGPPGSIVLDAHGVALRAQLEVASRLGARHLGIERRPLGADRTTAHAESNLQARGPPVVRLRVNSHVACVN